jgi:hypothetical protein
MVSAMERQDARLKMLDEKYEKGLTRDLEMLTALRDLQGIIGKMQDIQKAHQEMMATMIRMADHQMDNYLI